MGLTETKREFLRLLREDEEFRLAVAGLLGLDTILTELKRLREDFNRFVELEERRWEENWRRWEENEKRWEEELKRWEENQKRWEENQRRWEEAYKRFEAIELELKRLREDLNKLWEAHNRLREDFNRFVEIEERRWGEAYRRFDSLERKLVALGARWGIESEEAFREAMRGVVEEILGAGTVTRWVYYDGEGAVLGYPAQVEADIVVRDRTHVLVEVKASATDSDVAKLWRLGSLYHRVTGIRPRLVLVTPFIDERGLRAAERLGVEIYTST